MLKNKCGQNIENNEILIALRNFKHLKVYNCTNDFIEVFNKGKKFKDLFLNSDIIRIKHRTYDFPFRIYDSFMEDQNGISTQLNDKSLIEGRKEGINEIIFDFGSYGLRQLYNV